MIARILALLILAGVVAGGAWYVFRDTPQKKILRWREEARRLSERTADLEKAEELNDKVLQVIPSSAYDLVFKASLHERKGGPEGLLAAIEIYDKVLASGDPVYLGVSFLKARACRNLGLTAQAQGTLLSVADAYPFDVMVELGETSLASFSGMDALRHFSKARELAQGKAQEAKANEGLGDAYLFLRTLDAMPLAEAGLTREELERRNAERATLADSLRKSARRCFLDSLNYVKAGDEPATAEEASKRLAWAAGVYEKLALVKDPGESPCFDGVILLSEKPKAYGFSQRARDARLLIRTAALRLLAARDEGSLIERQGGAAAFEAAAERDFIEALNLAPEAARTLLEAASRAASAPPIEEGAASGQPAAGKHEPDGRSVEEYLQRLMAVSRVCLSTHTFGRLLNDGSPLQLARRLKDAASSGYPGAEELINMLLGLARLREGSAAEAERLIDAYLDSLPAEVRPRAAVDIAEQVGRLVPGDPVLFRFLEKFKSRGGKPFEVLGKRIGVLLQARARKGLEEESSRRLEDAVRLASESADGMAEHLGLAKVLYTLNGRDASIAAVKEALDRSPGERSATRVLADLLHEKAEDASMPAEQREVARKEALGECLALFVRTPSASQEVVRRSVELIRHMEESRGDADMAERLAPLYPRASRAAVAAFSGAIRAFFLAQFDAALDRTGSIDDPSAFRPFLSYLKASCRVGLAMSLQRDAAPGSDGAKSLEEKRREHTLRALEEFRAEPDFLPCRLEAANLELEGMSPADDLTDEFLKRIQEFAASEELEHAGFFLLAKAHHHRFQVRYPQESIKNADLQRLLLREQRALRSAIQRNPSFTAAYLLLAETFLVADRQEAAGDQGARQSRQVFFPDYAKAINLLKAVPNPDEPTCARLAQYFEWAGRLDEANVQLERLLEAKPTAEMFSRLLVNYLRSGSPYLKTFLDEAPPPADGAQVGKPRDRAALILDLRRAFDQLPERDGLRHMYAAMHTEKDLSSTTNEAKQKRLREETIAEFEKSIAGYEAKGVPAPVVVLNNLAWYLANDTDPARQARAIELSGQGKAKVGDPRKLPDVYDTYAWALFRAGKLLEAEKELRSLIEAVDRPEYRYHLAHVLFGLKRFDDALVEVRRARAFGKDFKEDAEALQLESDIKEARRGAIGR